MQVKAKGVHKVTAKGRTYYYAWRGGPRIDAEPESRDFLDQYVRLTRNRRDGPFEGRLAELVRLYCRSNRWTKLRESTRKTYLYCFDLIEAEFSDLPAADLCRPGARRMFLDWRDEIAEDRPRMADMTMSVLQAVLSFAVDRELIAVHPLEKVAKVTDGSRRDIIWLPGEINRFKATAPEHLVRSLMLGMWTGQRQGDLLRLTWSAYDGETITLRQSKTGSHVRVMVAAELRDCLMAAPRATAVTILTTADGQPWGSGFRSSWRKAVAAAGIADRTFHDLRGTFVTLAYRNGASIRDIAEITGHTERDAESIIRKHYLVSRAAVEAIERGERR